MSLRYEQYSALLKSKEFLLDLLYPNKRPKTIKELKQRSLDCLRHFPPLDEQGKPILSNDSFMD